MNHSTVDDNTSTQKTNEDILIKIEDVLYQVSKLVLVNSSPALKSILEDNPINRIHLIGIPPNIFNIFISYMHTGVLQINCQTLPDIFYAARKLKMKDVMVKCSQKLLARDVDSYFYLYVTATKLGLDPKKQQACEYIKKNFERCAKSEQFLLLDFEQIYEILAGNIVVQSGMTVFLALIQWLDYDINRLQHFASILNYIDFSKMSNEEVIQCVIILLGTKVMNNQEVKEFVHETIRDNSPSLYRIIF